MPGFSEIGFTISRDTLLNHRPELAGVVVRVFPDGPAAQAGIMPGDKISAVNNHPVEDVIDVQFWAADENCMLTVHRGPDVIEIAIDKDIDEQIGVEFQDDLFDGVRLCSNRCDFCFVDQQPKGMRKALAIRDDDFRLSFLHGNFVTLTNLTSHDWRRIFSQRLSPLYISVHATDITVRRRLLRNKRSGDILTSIQHLIQGGIVVHTQVVLCQGINDGAVLDKTIEELARLYPGVLSLAVVPMGVTDYRLERNESQPFNPASARKILRQIREWQRKFEQNLGTRFCVPSDEFYLLANEALPKAYTYDGFPQLSNGVGGSRLFLDELGKCVKKQPVERRRGRIQLVTGALALPLIQKLAQVVTDYSGYDTQVVSAINNWYGPSVTVAGLLTGRDVRDALNKAGRAEGAFFPDIMLRENSGMFLDDETVDSISCQTDRPLIAVSPWPKEALEAIRNWRFQG